MLYKKNDKSLDKLLTIFVILVSCVLVVCAAAFAGLFKSASSGNGEFNTEESMFEIEAADAAKECAIIGPASKDIECIYTGAYAIPSTVELKGGKYNVTTIDVDAFKNCTSLESVTIPSHIKKVNDEAFSGCTNLTSVYIENTSVITLGKNVFAGTHSNLRIFTSDASSTTAYKNAANWSTYSGRIETKLSLNSTQYTAGNLKYTVNSDGRAGVSGRANSDTIVNIPVTANLNGYILPVTTISDNAFSLTSVTSITLPTSLFYIGSFAFTLSSLSSINFPSSLLAINEGAFGFCAKLSSINLPPRLTIIGNSAFSACISLTSIHISSSLLIMGELVFFGCNSLASITVNPDSLFYSSDGRALFNKNKTTLITYANASGTSYWIPNTVTSIADYAFSVDTSISSTPSYLDTIVIPTSVTSISKNAFLGSTALSSITVNSSNPNYSSDGRALFNKNKTTLIFYANKSGTSYTVPDGVTFIEEYAFYSCSSLTYIFIVDSVTLIGDNAFAYCSSLTTVSIEKRSSTTFNGTALGGSGVFVNCHANLQIYVPNDATTLAAYKAATYWKNYASIIV